MKNLIKTFATITIIVFGFYACQPKEGDNTTTTTSDTASFNDGGQATVVDDVSQKNVVQVAVGSPDHTTLVAALKAGNLVDALANAGPFTVFAPTNAAFDKLPAGTVDDLLKKENLLSLKNILQYHVAVGVYKEDMMRDGQSLGMVNGGNATLGVTPEGKITINGANIIATVPASNGIVYVIDEVLLPK
ncbi:MAG: fasciclin domain-containing protein [Bacteroidetes bacterium]|nr:fasciclin domain-containing protein [Bacteroidota bacterium]